MDYTSGRNSVKEKRYSHSHNLLCHTFVNKMTMTITSIQYFYDLFCPGSVLVCDALLISYFLIIEKYKRCINFGEFILNI